MEKEMKVKEDKSPTPVNEDGAKLSQEEVVKQNGIVRKADGSYIWYYELRMFRNPAILFTLFKIFASIVFLMSLLVGFLDSKNIFESIKLIALFNLYGDLGLLALVALAYGLYALVLGRKYCVIFEMNEKSISHKQLDRQFKKAEVVSFLTTLVGGAAGSATTMGAGILAGTRNEMVTQFNKVKTMVVKRNRSVIYLQSGLSWNQIYVRKEDFDFVLDFITKRLPQRVKTKGL